MKKVLSLIGTCLVLAFIVISCNKKDNEEILKKAEPQEEILTAKEQKELSTIMFVIGFLEEGKTVILKGDGKGDFIVDPNSEKYESITSRKHDCESKNAVAFAKCVKAYVDSGKCMKVGSGDGGYYADVVDC